MPRVVPSQAVDLIDKLFPNAQTAEITNFSVSRENSHSIAGLLELVDKIPPELITVGAEQFAEFVTSIAALRTSQNEWLQRDYSVEFVRGLRRINPVALIRQTLASCHDELPSSGTPALLFIEPFDFRESVRLDLSAINSSLVNGEWKATTVLAGSVVETLLLWALRQKNFADVKFAAKNKDLKVKPHLQYWVLHEYIEVA